MTISLPGERVKARLLKNLRQQQELKVELLQSLGSVSRVLKQSSPDLSKAIALIEHVQAQINASEGHVAESLERVEDDKTTYDLLTQATIVTLEREYFKNDPAVVAEVLRETEVLGQAFALLSDEEQARVLRAMGGRGPAGII